MPCLSVAALSFNMPLRSFLPKGHRTCNPGKGYSDCPGASHDPLHDSETSSRKPATTLIIPCKSLKWSETIPIHLRIRERNSYTGSSSSPITFEDSASAMPPTMVEFDPSERQSCRRRCAVSCSSSTTVPTHASVGSRVGMTKQSEFEVGSS